MIDEGWRLEINLVELSGSSRSESNERSTRLGPRSGTEEGAHMGPVTIHLPSLQLNF